MRAAPTGHCGLVNCCSGSGRLRSPLVGTVPFVPLNSLRGARECIKKLLLVCASVSVFRKRQMSNNGFLSMSTLFNKRAEDERKEFINMTGESFQGQLFCLLFSADM